MWALLESLVVQETVVGVRLEWQEPEELLQLKEWDLWLQEEQIRKAQART
jgi:hypothetical protein